MNVLGIETSCDETSAAVVSDGRTILSNIVASQADLHALYGGVVPEVASRKHVENMIPTLQEALKTAHLSYQDIHAIAVTNRPGLLGALLIGVSAAKALAYVLKIPVICVNHLEGHVYSNILTEPSLTDAFPILILLVSGGHTQIIRMNGQGIYSIIGKTRDDAAGEAFDKGARLMGLPYPGGPNVDRLASSGNAKAVRFPRANLGDTLDFSFSGLKTSIRTFTAKDQGATRMEDVAASFQAAIVDVLVEKLKTAAERSGITTICIAGGVAANTGLQKAMRIMAINQGLRLVIPPIELCTDNAAMIAAAGYYRLQNNLADTLDFDTLANSPLG